MSSVTIPTEKELRERPFVTLNFVVVGGSPSHRHDLCQQLVALSAESEFLHCTAASFGSVEELAKGVSEITENVLCVVVVDMTSVLDCESLEKWLVGLHKLQFFGKVCIAIYNGPANVFAPQNSSMLYVPSTGLLQSSFMGLTKQNGMCLPHLFCAGEK
ncbi:uncharacterized protein LOC144100882 isoform X2 [Amblyomma americanum]